MSSFTSSDNGPVALEAAEVPPKMAAGGLVDAENEDEEEADDDLIRLAEEELPVPDDEADVLGPLPPPVMPLLRSESASSGASAPFLPFDEKYDVIISGLFGMRCGDGICNERDEVVCNCGECMQASLRACFLTSQPRHDLNFLGEEKPLPPNCGKR